MNDNLTPKQRYYKKIYDNAPLIECACGCGTLIKSKDKYGRDKKYVNGHNNRKYDDPTQYKREWNHRHRKERYEYKVKRVDKIRDELIRNAGGKCQHCGVEYNGMNAPIFDLHHVDPSTKSFNLNKNYLSHYSLESIREEAKKCILLCSNCHRMHHWGKED